MATGRVYKRGTVWYLDIRTGRVIDGLRERIRKPTKAKLKSDAQELLNIELYKYDRLGEGSAIHNRCKISFIAQQWFQHNELHVLNSKTRNDYRLKVEQFINALNDLGISEIDQITSVAIDDIVNQYLKTGDSHNTINKRIVKFKAMIDYAIDRNHIVSNPMARYKCLPDKPVKMRRALTDAEAKELVKVSPPQYAIVWKTFLCCGLREAELIHLPATHIDQDKESLAVAEYKDFSPKTKAGIRTIPLHSSLLRDILGRQRRSPSEYIFLNEFGRPHRPDTLLRAFKRCMYNALCSLQGIPYGFRLSKEDVTRYGDQIADIEEDLKSLDVHSLRYTFCTALVKSGVDIKTVQTLMGHSSPLVTLKIYAQYCNETAQGAVIKLPYVTDLPEIESQKGHTKQT